VDGLRLAIGTFTIAPVPPPRVVDADTGRIAMIWAPFVGLALGLAAEAVVAFVRFAVHGSSDHLLAAVVGVAALAWFSRGLHLDGLMDTADGLGSSRPAAEALEVMDRPEVGALGVATVLMVVALQIAALYSALTLGHGTLALVGGATVARLAASWSARRSLPAARPGGLGATVAGTQSLWVLVVLTVVVGGALAAAAQIDDDHVPGLGYVLELAMVLALLVAAGLFAHRVSRRLGGMTGDVFGAVIEVAFLVFVICSSFQPHWFHHLPGVT
jgi:adenosylcobinamide-GDP ribazoletransferase